MKKVLCILENGFEEIEAITPIDLLRRAGIEVVLAGVSGKEVSGGRDVKVVADCVLDEVSAADFDVLLLPGGPAVMDLRKNTPVIQLIREFSESGKLIAAICAAPLLLHDAGVLKDAKFTAHFSTENELPASSGERVVLDQNILTSHGAGTAIDFGLTLVELLVGTTKRAEISSAVMC